MSSSNLGRVGEPSSAKAASAGGRTDAAGQLKRLQSGNSLKTRYENHRNSANLMPILFLKCDILVLHLAVFPEVSF